MRRISTTKKVSFLLLAGFLSISLAACFKNPVTGRSSLNIVGEGELRNMANAQYSSFLAENTPMQGTRDVEMVKRIGNKMAKAVEQYLASKGQQNLISDYKWEFNLVNENQVNAWCMPGGKVVVYTGIMPVAQSETGLAVIMGHEIAHAIARHGNERMSQQMVAQAGGVTLSALLSTKPAQAQQLFNTAYGIGSQLGVLAYSRSHESEADRMGLIFMAMAGYNPNEAVNFWGRMAALSGGQAPPEFLSTHPSNQRRINDIKGLLPEAMKYYKPQ